MKTFQTDIERRVDALQYDFAQFELDHFIQHIVTLRQRNIAVHGFSLKPDFTGMWVPTPSTDYLIYNNTLHPIHQTHAILHEIAHMVLGHACQPLHEIISPEVLEAMGMIGMVGQARILSSGKTVRQQEVESEAFVFALQRRVIHAQRIEMLLHGKSSVPLFRPFADGMAFED